jgi:hypothetical protein
VPSTRGRRVVSSHTITSGSAHYRHIGHGHDCDDQLVSAYRARVLIAVSAALLIVGCAGLALYVRAALADSKDRRDVLDLTSAAPWPRDQLVLPDEIPGSGVTGSVGHNGLSLSYPFDGEAGVARMVRYGIEVLDERGESLWGPSCAARAVLACTDLGDGYTLMRIFDTDNSDAATSVRRRVDDQLLVATVAGVHLEDVDRLRRIVTRTHRPTDDELLRILRYDGYQTDWS